MQRLYLTVLTAVAALALCLSVGAASASAQITLGPTVGDPETQPAIGKFHVLGLGVVPPATKPSVMLLLGTCADLDPKPNLCEFGGPASRVPSFTGTFLIKQDSTKDITLEFDKVVAGEDTFKVTAPVLAFTYTDAGGTLNGDLTLLSPAKQLDLEPDGGRGDIVIEGKLKKTGGTIGGAVNTMFDVNLTFSIGGNKESIRLLPAGQTLSGGSLRKGTINCICSF